jgi:hypothetical protein
VTSANKILVGLLVAIVALGGAFGGGYYVDYKQRKLVEKKLEESQKKLTTLEAEMTKELARSRGRNQLIEATLALVYQNPGMAFDRTVRTQGLAARIGLNIQAELDEIRTLIMQQRPEAISKLLALADKFEPVVGVNLPSAPPPSPPKVPPAAVAPSGAAPSAATPPAAAPAAGSDLEPVREALRQAKEIVLVGGELSDAARKLARAQILLNEAGNSSLDAELSSAIKAARSRDEARVRSSIDAVISQLRTP